MKKTFMVILTLTLFGVNSFADPLLSKDCRAKEDQKGSFRVAIPQTMKLIVDSRFRDDHKKIIFSAAATWNKEAKKILGQNFFEVVVEDVPQDIKDLLTPQCETPYGDQTKMYVVARTTSEWLAMGFHQPSEKNVFSPAVTYSCADVGTHRFYQAIMFVNSDAGLYAMFRSFVLHEMGHALGLDHSCDKFVQETPRPDFLSCKDVPDGHPYHLAVMYPAFRKNFERTSSGFRDEVKNELSKNDIIRLQCLYGPR